MPTTWRTAYKDYYVHIALHQKLQQKSCNKPIIYGTRFFAQTFQKVGQLNPPSHHNHKRGFFVDTARSDAVASRLQVSDLYKSDLQVSSQFANNLMLKKLKFLRINKLNSWFLGLKILQVFFENRGETLILKKNEFLELFGFTLCFRTFLAKKIWNFFSAPDW